jgi:predicted alpha/beta superfamily hydrolase
MVYLIFRKSFLSLFLLSAIFSVQLFAQQKNRILSIYVTVPASTFAHDTLYIVGDRLSLGEWNPSLVRMQRIDDSTWSYRDSYKEGETVEFKITLGRWEKEAIYKAGVIPANHSITMNNDTTVHYRIVGWSEKDTASAGDVKSTGGITGTVRYHRDMQGEKILLPRDMIVWLPPSYEEEPQRRYPVLYMHDGQNIIDPTISFTRFDWRVDDVADSLIKRNTIEEIIIVGIYNSIYRGAEYSDTDTGRAYARFVVNTLKPFIDKTYRTKPDAKNTAVMGSSAGGLISFLFAWWYPEVFSKAACLSSAFLLKKDKIIKEVAAYAGLKKSLRFYIDVGGVGLEQRLKLGADEMVKILKQKGYVDGVDLEDFYVPTAEHNERAWAARVWRPLVFFFGK